ncbi:MAG: type I-E CRISPR-associated protein Cse2/CasB [Lentisphaeria bacterium]|nr:type I-E CRISPR-associated protein Cse2/CasB [Lentisphaeria bacterium]
MSTAGWNEQAARFLVYLQRYREDRGALAALRGILSEARRPRAWPLLGGFPGAIGHRAFETVAGLWAAAPETATEDDRTLGDVLRAFTSEHGSIEGRFLRLLACDRDEIPEHIVPLVRVVQAKGARLNYTQLLSDLLWWNERVIIEWAKAFWEAPEETEGIAADLLSEPPSSDRTQQAGETVP